MFTLKYYKLFGNIDDTYLFILKVFFLNSFLNFII